MARCSVIIPNPGQDEEIVLTQAIAQQIAALVTEHWHLVHEHGFCVFFGDEFEERKS